MIERDNPIASTETRLLISELQAQVIALQTAVTNLPNNNAPSQGSGTVGATPQAVNQIRNGTFSHSVNSWDDVVVADNGRYEAAWYYSHPIAPGQAMFKGNQILTNPTLVLGVVSIGADTITITDHGLITGTPFRVTGNRPAPLALATTYYVIVVDANTIQVAATYADSLTATAINLTTTTTGGNLEYNYTLKDAAHTVDSDTFADWQISTGSARLTDNLSDLSCFFPGNNIEAGYTYYAVFSLVKTTQYVFASPTCRIFCGIWGYSTSAMEWNWLNAPYKITAQVLGTVATPTTREYLVYVETDRGITISTSPELVVSAPSDADYAAGAVVYLSWPRPLGFGVTNYNIYRRTGTDFVPADVSLAGDSITIADHGLETGQPIQFTNSGGGLPAPLVAGTVYYAIEVDPNEFQVAATEADALAGTEIDLTTQGTGTHALDVYLLLFQSSGVSFIDNNSFQEFATGYPTADYNELVAYTATSPNVVATLPYAGDPLTNGWATVSWNIRTPQDYNQGDTDLTKGQWLRWGLTEPLDLRVTGCTVFFNSNDVVSTAGQFTSALIGKTITITTKTDTLTTTVTTVSDSNNLQVNDNWTGANSSAATIVITNGAPPHSLMIDLAHATWQQGASFSPNPEDISPDRGIPSAVPNGTTQGPTIPGPPPQTPDGGQTCLYQEEIVVTENGEMAAIDLRVGMRLPDGYDGLNTLIEKEVGVASMWLVVTKNGATVQATETKLIYVDHGQTKSLGQIEKGDSILTSCNGVITPSTVINKEILMERAIVVKMGLMPGHSFLAGTNATKVLVNNVKPIPEFPQV